MSENPIRYLKQNELADRWQISPRTLERWRWSGDGPVFLKIGGRVLYRISDIEAYEATLLRSRTDVAVIRQVETPLHCSPQDQHPSTRKHARPRCASKRRANTRAKTR